MDIGAGRGSNQKRPTILGAPGADFRTISSAFDSFETMDEPSYIRLWSCDEIAAHRNAGGADVIQFRIVSIGDFLIDPNYYYVDIAADAAPVRWFGDDEIQAPNLRDFVAAIAAGRLDV